MPNLIQGIPIAEASEGMKFEQFSNIVHYSIECGVRAFDTSAAYGPSEAAIGKMMPTLRRHDLFITTKISNEQQMEWDIDACIDHALKLMKTDYIDCMLFHWPYPGYVEKWKSLEQYYKKGILRSIGIANVRERHIRRMLQDDIEIRPHVIQIEVHPFNTVDDMLRLCAENSIAIQACSSLMGMQPKLSRDLTLNELAVKYGKSLSQLILRWHQQRGIAPIFRAFKPEHLRQSSDVYDFNLSDDDMKKISDLNEDYRFHVESMNCPGF